MEDTATKFIISLLVTIVGFFLTYFFTKKPWLRFFYGAVTEIPLPKDNSKIDDDIDKPVPASIEVTEPPTTLEEKQVCIRSHTVVISNQGNATAHNLRIGHFVLPIAYTVHPPMNIPVDNKHPKNELLIPTLSPKETVTISYLYPPNIHVSQVNAYIKCDEGIAEVANLEHVSVKSPVFRNTIGIMFFIGVVTSVYWLIKIGTCLYKTCLFS